MILLEKWAIAIIICNLNKRSQNGDCFATKKKKIRMLQTEVNVVAKLPSKQDEVANYATKANRSQHLRLSPWCILNKRK